MTGAVRSKQAKFLISARTWYIEKTHVTYQTKLQNFDNTMLVLDNIVLAPLPAGQAVSCREP
jgi:hypothetical protein